MSVWLSTVRIGNQAFHLWSGHVDHTVWETTGVIGDLGVKGRGEEVELMADGEGLKKGPKKGTEKRSDERSQRPGRNRAQ